MGRHGCHLYLGLVKKKKKALAFHFWSIGFQISSFKRKKKQPLLSLFWSKKLTPEEQGAPLGQKVQFIHHLKTLIQNSNVALHSHSAQMFKGFLGMQSTIAVLRR